jgi:LonB protease-like protein
MDRSAETIRAYAGFVTGKEGMFCSHSPATVGRVVEHGARRAEHQVRLVTRCETIDDLLVEA